MFLDTFYELVEKIELHDKIKAKKNLKFHQINVWKKS